MEVTLNIPFSPSEISMLDMHSVLNVLTVLQYEFIRLQTSDESSLLLDPFLEHIAHAAGALSDPEKAYDLLAHVSQFETDCLEKLDEVGRLNLSPAERSAHQAACANVQGVFKIILIRAQELLDRRNNPFGWVCQDVSKLKENFLKVLQAIEKNSHGAYRIVYNLAQHDAGDYLIHLDITGNESGLICMPPVFQDVMRDLIANARKYTPPGGTITAGLSSHQGCLRFVVTDTGCGIPPAELMEVAKFGYRASNVLNRPTCGGGFGLTKAYYVTRSFAGRMWIDSPVSDQKGTRVEIQIPFLRRT